ncbi:cadherin-like domain-containing protein [Roseomonas sp. GC11]|uniref:cadherin-like domain-containing protein n=1 Tax=Roseomonas sp. GC11 TaxID=2950546 RepID=UPI00210B0D72|nr:cadherin-like domain-containing protein [Roseomonas sp. GC11]MCQ4161738.1 cadherin-like domain-containing protein [Roseomonas sp. GC11]
MRSSTLWAALALPALLAACAKSDGPAPTAASRLPVYAVDLQGKSSICTLPAEGPRLVDGQQAETTMTVGNDGGWCGVSVARPGPEPFDAGLLIARPAKGTVVVKAVGDYTRLDYVADAGFVGTDSFTVRLLPGSTSVKVNVTVQGVTPPAAAPVVTPRVTAPPATSTTRPAATPSTTRRTGSSR